MIKLRQYRHYKGQKYRVITLAKDENTLEDVVVYEALSNNPVSKFWIIKLKNFTEDVEVGGKKVPRFEFIEE